MTWVTQSLRPRPQLDRMRATTSDPTCAGIFETFHDIAIPKGIGLPPQYRPVPIRDGTATGVPGRQRARHRDAR